MALGEKSFCYLGQDLLSEFMWSLEKDRNSFAIVMRYTTLSYIYLLNSKYMQTPVRQWPCLGEGKILWAHALSQMAHSISFGKDIFIPIDQPLWLCPKLPHVSFHLLHDPRGLEKPLWVEGKMTPSRALEKAWQKVQKHWKMLSFGKGQGSFGLGKGQKTLEKAKKHWKRQRSLGKGQGGFGKCSSLEKAKVAFLYNHVSPMTRGKDLDCSLKNACFAAPEILIFLLISYGQNHPFFTLKY